MWKNIVKPDKPQTVWHMHIACWISKATNPHSEYIILISTATMVAHTCLSVHYTYIAYLVCVCSFDIYWYNYRILELEILKDLFIFTYECCSAFWS